MRNGADNNGAGNSGAGKNGADNNGADNNGAGKNGADKNGAGNNGDDAGNERDIIETRVSETHSAVSDEQPRRSESAQMTLERGVLVDHYVLLRKIGEGGMGVVYAAYDPDLDRRVALKFLHSQLTGAVGREREQSRLLREAQAMAKLSHHNVATVFAVGMFRGRVYIAMEFVEGHTFREWLDQRERSWDELWPVLRGAGRGLVAAHAAGIIHRDFKPDNILVDSTGRARVTDFGLARPVGDPIVSGDSLADKASGLHTWLTHTGAIMGTPRYMAPEQHQGRNTTERTDQFAFCLVLFEALYGERAFRGETVKDLATAVTKGELVSPKKRVRIPQYRRDAIVRGLCVRPRDRFASMSELLGALARTPHARRNRVVVTAIAIAGGIAAVMVLTPSASHPHHRDMCAAAGQEMDALWNDGRRQQLATAFRKVRSNYAEFTLVRVRGELDRYASVWKTNRVKLCRDQERSSADEAGRRLHTARAGCLARWLTRVDAAVTTLAKVNKPMLTRALLIVNDATAGSCDDISKLSRQVALPSPRHVRKQIRQVQRTLDKLRPALTVERDLGKMRRELEALLGQARFLGYAPLLAEILEMYGGFLDRLREDKAAEKLFREATTVAAVAQDDVLVARAWINVMWSVGVRQKRIKEAMALAATLESVLARAGNPVRLRAHYSHTYASVLRNSGKTQQLLAQSELSARLTENALGPDHVNLGATLQSLSETYRYVGRYDQAETVARRAIAIFEKHYGPQHPRVADGFTVLASAQKLQGQHDKALQGYQRALKLARTAYPPDHPTISRSLDDIAELLASIGKADKALPYAREAATRAERHFGKESVNVAPYYYRQGVVLARIKKFRAAIRMCRYAARLQVVKMAKSWAYANSVNCVAGALIKLRRFREAVPPATLAYDIMAVRRAPPAVMIPMELTLSTALWNSKRDRQRALVLMQAAFAAAGPRLKKQLLPGMKAMRAHLGKTKP